MANLTELLKQREALDAQIAEMQNGARNEAIAKVRELMSQHGLTMQDLSSSGRKERKPATVAPKYRNQATGETWSGRGLQPKWLRAAIAGGASLESFRL